MKTLFSYCVYIFVNFFHNSFFSSYFQFPKDKDTKDKLGSSDRDKSKEAVISSRPVATSASVATTTVTASTLSTTTPASPLTGTSVSTSTTNTATTTTTTASTTTTTSSVISSVPQTTSASTNTIISSVSSSATPSNLTNRAVVKGTKLLSKQPEAQKTSPVPENAITTIPKFYFPNGRPAPAEEIEATLQNVATEFSKAEGGKLSKHNMPVLVKVRTVC